jgi:hypothetical protein
VSWLIRHLDWLLVGGALILSVVWISDHIRHPLVEEPPVAIVNHHHVPPGASSAQPSVAMPA